MTDGAIENGSVNEEESVRRQGDDDDAAATFPPVVRPAENKPAK